MAKVDVSGYRNGLHAFYGPILGLYTDNATAPLNARAGLRQLYKFGLYSHCAYVNETAGKCTDTTAAYEFQPYTVITSDMLANYSGYTNNIIHNTAFFNSPSLGEHTHSAYYLLLLGTIGAIISIVAGAIRRVGTVSIATFSAVVSSILILAGSAHWTAAIKKAEGINTFAVNVESAQIPLGIEVSAGIGLYLAWAAYACLVMSIIPYIIICCTFRS